MLRIKSPRVTAVTEPLTGKFCVTVTGLKNGVNNAVATIDYDNTDGPEAEAVVITQVSFSPDCPNTTDYLEFRTFRHPEVTMNNTRLVSPPVLAGDVGFTFMVF